MFEILLRSSITPLNFPKLTRNLINSNVNKLFYNNFRRISTFPGIHSKSNFYANFTQNSLNELNHLLIQKKNFAGRQRGLKRRKSKKEPRRIQHSLGRRLELFWPKKRRKLRIRLVQNARGNVIYDPVLKKFLVFYYKQGTQVFRGFRANGNKFELAKAKALNFARQMTQYYTQRYNKIIEKFHTHTETTDGKTMDGNTNHSVVTRDVINYNVKLQPDCNLSGVRGIFFDVKTSSWVVKFVDSGVRKYKFFSTELGFGNSYTNAVEFLRFQLYRNHQFLHRRHRTRKNRPILK
ncbi:hypothetical protein TpMuguga_03g00032 [Theileria parva strain Muguga]|uniref:AP2/ERF domain-containing protein n=1 Tax=Theileria parva TaxID=5875 RepID=Q4N0S5_THEPA|nr:uncharacterized protein TpMuguga_03g00032 [Theileria parva strain Muguga]EAN30768.1 hypothetical protein TpMuguga_03g00032 [Theileria parva strain Muguga]|eukprot:XP_763051.1 hypothetical protein [Theileria parva strain Muguga]